MCHIRPEPEFLTTNISVLKLGEALRKLPNTIVNVPTLEPESIEIHASVFFINNILVHIFNVYIIMILETNGALYTRTAHLRDYERPEKYDGHDGRAL